MSQEPIEQMLASIPWTAIEQTDPIDGSMPYATHVGALKIGDFEFKCYTLNDGRRVFDADDVARFFAADTNTNPESSNAV